MYDFTNGGLDDYSLNVAPKELLINDVETTPYYDAASGTYMALVKPETNYSISGTYQGAKEMAFSAAGSLAGGKAKMYTINDPNKINHTLQVGDYLCADGNLVSMELALFLTMRLEWFAMWVIHSLMSLIRIIVLKQMMRFIVTIPIVHMALS